MILLIDNFDSFVHNLARQFRLLGHDTEVVRNDAISVAEIRAKRPSAIVISPGPGRPEEAGVSMQLTRELQDEIPILGVCLGHQVIGEVFGAKVTEASKIMHGQTSEISHLGQGLFAGLSPQLIACRYHSLVIDPDSLEGTDLIATAWTVDGSLMALRHREKPLYGVQFHPEAILTESGPALLHNFLQEAGVDAN